MNNESKIWLILGVVFALCAHSLYSYLWVGAFYQLTAFTFVCYIRTLYLNIEGDWSFVVFVVWLSTIDSLLDELFFRAQEVSYHEYVSFTIIILLSIKYKTKWTR